MCLGIVFDVGTAVAGGTTHRICRVYAGHERRHLDKAAVQSAIDTGPVGGIRMTQAAVRGRGNVIPRLGDHCRSIMIFAVMTG